MFFSFIVSVMVFVMLAMCMMGSIGIISSVMVNGCFVVVFINSKCVFCGMFRSIVVVIFVVS